MKLDEQCRAVEWSLADVACVLTERMIVLDNAGIETKAFHVRDGLGIKLWRRAGFRFGIITARNSQIVKQRASELGIDIVRQGFEEKLPAAQQVVAELGLRPAQVCYIGDALPALPAIRFAGLGVAVADAVAEVRNGAHWVTQQRGGSGAVREVVERILKAKHRWDGMLQKYLVQ